MELRQLEYLVGVADAGTFTGAAVALHVSQPALSQGIARLEAELGIELFHRVGRRATLAPAGTALLAHARRVLREAAAARHAVEAVRGIDAGTLDLVALPTLAADPVAPLVGELRRRHPGVTVTVQEPETAAGVTALVADATCELGLTELPVATGALVADELLRDELLAVSPPGTEPQPDPLPVRALAGVPIVATPPGTSTRRVVDAAFADAGLEPAVVVTTAQREAIGPLVLAGAGTSFLPATAARQARAAGAIVRPLAPPLARRIGVVRRDAPLSPAAEVFVELARARAAGGAVSPGRDGPRASRSARRSDRRG
jgi:LysR family transcriptional regulator, carnitine catabolism transcriptional activator